MEILTGKEMREIDRKATKDCGIPGTVLMENAGIQSVLALEEKFHNLNQKKVAVFIGKGNNGGDGAVVARHLHNKGVNSEIFLFSKKETLSPDSKINMNIAQEMGISINEIESYDHLKNFQNKLIHSHIFIDALLGTGIKPPVKGFLQSVIPFLNSLNKFVLSIDIPSGLSSDHGNVEGEVVQANMTVTFCRPKRCHFLYPAANYVGELKVVDISIPDKIVKTENIKVHTIEKKDIQFLLTKRKPSTHKGTYGHLLVVGGSTGMGGAAAMASLSALRMGTGLVTLAVPKSLNASIEINLLEAMSIPLPETDQGTIDFGAKKIILESLKSKSAFLIGPGISTHPRTKDLFFDVIANSLVPMVIDADGLNCLSEDLNIFKILKAPVIITPHPGEMSRITGKPIHVVQSDRIGIAQSFAQNYNVLVALKGAGTVIALPDGNTFINTTGNPGMATAGSGDVLAGMIAGLIAQKVPPAEALKAAVFVHGWLGDNVSQKKGQIPLIARDLIDEIPSILGPKNKTSYSDS